MFLELRQYRTKPGQRENWVRFMDEVIIPFQREQGMEILGSFTAQDEDDLYVWIRRFADDDERKRLYAAVYRSDRWRDEIDPRVGEMIDVEKIKVTRLDASPKSAIQ